jgi:hypothetical protein
MGTNDISGMLIYFKHCKQQHTLQYSTTIAQHTLQQSVESCARFVEIMLANHPNLHIFICDVFKDNFPPYILLWKMFKWLLNLKCTTTPNHNEQHENKLFVKELENSSTSDIDLRQHSYYNHPFFQKHITLCECKFFEDSVEQYSQHLRWLNKSLESLCKVKQYRFIRFSRHLNQWNKQACTMYKTIHHFDHHYVSELMVISLLEAIATYTILISPTKVHRLTKRLYKQYTKRLRFNKHTVKICKYKTKKHIQKVFGKPPTV